MHPLLSTTKQAAVHLHYRFQGSEIAPSHRTGCYRFVGLLTCTFRHLVNAGFPPSQPQRPVTCFRRKEARFVLTAQRIRGKRRVQVLHLIPLFSEQEYVSRQSGVAHLPQKPEQYLFFRVYSLPKSLSRCPVCVNRRDSYSVRYRMQGLPPVS